MCAGKQEQREFVVTSLPAKPSGRGDLLKRIDSSRGPGHGDFLNGRVLVKAEDRSAFVAQFKACGTPLPGETIMHRVEEVVQRKEQLGQLLYSGLDVEIHTVRTCSRNFECEFCCGGIAVFRRDQIFRRLYTSFT